MRLHLGNYVSTRINRHPLPALLLALAFVLLHGCRDIHQDKVDLLPNGQHEEIYSFSQIVAKEGFILNRTNDSQPGYRGHYLSGRLSKHIQRGGSDWNANMLIYLLAKEGATEFDGEIAYEFKHDFFGSDFYEVARDARRSLLQDTTKIVLSQGEFKRVKAWLEGV